MLGIVLSFFSSPFIIGVVKGGGLHCDCDLVFLHASMLSLLPAFRRLETAWGSGSKE